MSKRQHTVQKRLLSNFSSTPQIEYNKQQIWFFDKKNQKSKEVSLDDIGLIKNFLTTEADNNITEIEKECYPIIDRIAKKRCVMCDYFDAKEKVENHLFLYRYIGKQLHRTIYRREQLGKLPYWQEREGKEIKDYQSSYFQFNPRSTYFIDLGIGRLKEENRRKLAEVYYNMIPEISNIPLLPVDGMAGSIFDISVPIVTINESKIPYIQNDIGLVPFFPLNFEGFNLNLITGEQIPLTSLLSFPICPKICINLCTIKSVSKWVKKIPENSARGLILRSDDEKSFKSTNTFLLRFAERFIYSNRKINKNFFI